MLALLIYLHFSNYFASEKFESSARLGIQDIVCKNVGIGEPGHKSKTHYPQLWYIIGSDDWL